MKLGMIGLGRMGANMAQRLVRGGHEVVGFDLSAGRARGVTEKGAESAASLEALVAELAAAARRVADGSCGRSHRRHRQRRWCRCSRAATSSSTAATPTTRTRMRRARRSPSAGIDFVDCGTSGGVWGLKEGYSLMIGGDAGAVERLRPIFETLAPAPDRGWGHVGPSGAGHFVKMVHNGIEYGLMQAYAEGFAIMQHKTELRLDLHQVAEIWRHGSVVRSWLLDLTAAALKENPTLDGIAPLRRRFGRGPLDGAEAIDLDVPAPVITLSLLARLRSRDPDSFADKLLAAMRNQFGGHAVRKE